MIKTVPYTIDELNNMHKYPNELFYKGNLELLKKKKISVVGSRSPNQYAKEITQQFVSKLAQRDVCIVSGGAMGIDTIAHHTAGLHNTIMVAGTGLDKRYPAINKKMIETIEQKGLVLSQFKSGVLSNKYNFPIRNEITVALGDILIVPYADLNSGTLTSVKFAQKQGKSIYVFPHELKQSLGTQKLLQESKATCIYDMDAFLSEFGQKRTTQDTLLCFCENHPTYEETLERFGAQLFEYELQGKVIVKNGKVSLS